ncbi:MAG: hypothetical protein RIB59_09320 [Rhodospirillales bacterium]
MKVQHATATKTTGFIAAAFAIFALASMSLFAAGPAHADGYKHHGKHHGHYKGHRNYKGKSKTVVILRSNGYTSFSHPAYPYRRHYFVTDRPVCRVVSKIDYWYGRRAEIGGTACPDAYGNLAVVQGSHYLIRYLF